MNFLDALHRFEKLVLAFLGPGSILNSKEI